MADDLRMALTNLLSKAEMVGGVDFLRDRVRSRRLCEEYPYVWLGRHVLEGPAGGACRISTAVVNAIDVTATGEREVLGLDVCPWVHSNMSPIEGDKSSISLLL